MGRLRNWIVSNPFFQKDGYFSKSAFIMINTWIAVIAKYIVSGITLSYTKAASVVLGVAIPASSALYTAKFDSGEALALLTLVFGLYFGNKFSPNSGNGASDSSKEVK